MALRALLSFGAKYFQHLRRIPNLIYRVPKTFQLPRVYVNRIVKPRGSWLANYLRNIGGVDSLVKSVYRSISAASTHQRPNSLLRAYSGLAGSVHLRHQLFLPTQFSFTAINEVSKKRESSWFGEFFSSFSRYRTLPNLINQSSSLIPKELIGVGCNSAVWAADLAMPENTASGSLDDGSNNEMAVKVLYNYYASSPPEGSSPYVEQNDDISTSSNKAVQNSVDWVLLQRQLKREGELRPPAGHPNIVPLVSHFIDRAPAPSRSTDDSNRRTGSTNASITDISNSNNNNNTGLSQPTTTTDPVVNGWVGAESFPEGFGGRPFTYYLLMPRFDATLEDLLNGSWYPFEQTVHASESQDKTTLSVSSISPLVDKTTSADSDSLSFVIQQDNSIVQPPSSVRSQCPSQSSSVDHLVNSQNETSISPPDINQLLEVDEVVAILAQLFDAVAELERHSVAHRDIKLNNILVRRRTPTLPSVRRNTYIKPSFSDNTRLKWLDDGEVIAANTRFHVALTDFGCAIRTAKTYPDNLPAAFLRLFEHLFSSGLDNSQIYFLTHSGNTALLAPEIASSFNLLGATTCTLTETDYARADLWAMATLAYPLFGMTNPFTEGTLFSATYVESDLPALPDRAPGVVTWLVSQCLQRNPHVRPAADLVADVLNTWCLLRHMNRRQRYQRRLQPVAWVRDGSLESGPESSESRADQVEFAGQKILHGLRQLGDGELTETLSNQIQALLNVCWAADWLTGPARPPDGLRVPFYQRVTLNRLAVCLRIVDREEHARARRIAQNIAQQMTPDSFVSCQDHSQESR
ncbi:hypothetical protein EG68_04611 [Paragonimus skrjabini miyazakii]|uniref:non-specific serine/threonine protein kinase n=1 Tax=Paragonimus skrjabini miyazakii TaxID=59628 RepID=A0A8S9YYD1_9TREM|nr:hypothetical protein EG68_04611 [Paragonimus skrjabini miyazakii]